MREMLQGYGLVVGVGLAGCQVIGGYESFEESAPRTPHPCDGLPTRRETAGLGAEVLIKAKDGRCFWIDETEVTVGQYQRFVHEANGQLPAMDLVSCGWKAQLTTPADGQADCAKEALADDPRAFETDKPIRCVDWCDAHAYCNWAGKDLCGVALVIDDFYPPREPEQWTIACSPDSAFPYGPTPQRRVCNIGMRDEECGILLGQSRCSAARVKRFSQCTYPHGPFDMIGNVSEWMLPCRKEVGDAADGSTAGCVHRGGSYENSELDFSCSLPAHLTAPRNEVSPARGFRCCAPGAPASERLTGRSSDR